MRNIVIAVLAALGIAGGAAYVTSLPADKFECPSGYVRTTGEDPDSRLEFTVCQANQLDITITKRDGQKPIGYRGGEQLADSEIVEILSR